MMNKHRLGPPSLGPVGSKLRVGRQVPIQGRGTGHEIIFVVQAKGSDFKRLVVKAGSELVKISCEGIQTI